MSAADQPAELGWQTSTLQRDSSNTAFHATVFAEIDVLRRRLYDLEGLHARVSSLESSRAAQEGNSYRSNTEDAPIASTDYEQDAATTLEFFALGADRRTGRDVGQHSTAEFAGPDMPVRPLFIVQIAGLHSLLSLWSQTLNILDVPSAALTEAALAALLPRYRVEPILAFSSEMCIWQHSCVQSLQFKRECAAFFDLLDMLAGQERFRYVRPAWLALYLAVQAIAVSQMSEQDASQSGLTDAEQATLPGIFFEGCMSCLNLAKYLEEPSLTVLQTISVLVSFSLSPHLHIVNIQS